MAQTTAPELPLVPSPQQIAISVNQIIRGRINLLAGSGITLAYTNDGLTITGGGGAGATWSEAEFDFGTSPVWNKQFTLTDATITSSAKKVMIVPSGNAPTSGLSDEWEFDSITFAALAGAGSATVYASATPGPITGKRKVFYTVG